MKKEVFFTFARHGWLCLAAALAAATLAAATLVAVLLVCACSSPMSGPGGETGSFTITIGDESGRATLPWDGNIQVEDLDFAIRLFNGPGPAQTRTGVKANQTVNFTVAVGIWEASVEATKDGVLKAEGYTVMNVRSGMNGTVRIQMKQPDGDDSFTITIGLLKEQSAEWHNGAYGTVAIIQGSEKGNKPGDTVTVTATHNPDYHFVKWVASDNINGDFVDEGISESPGITSYTFTINANTTLYAVFDGNGTTTPKNIVDAEELAKVGNSDYPDYPLNGKYALMTDIDLKGEEWTPIGDNSTNSDASQFTGTFDGNGKKITGLYINDTSSSLVNAGLFGYVGASGTIKNIGVESANIINSDNPGDATGGVAGINNGTVQNCYFNGFISGTDEVGGVVGLNMVGTVSNCYSSGTVSSEDNNVGGVVGHNYGTVQNCYSTSTVTSTSSGIAYVGGVVGNNDGTVRNCYSTSTVTSTSSIVTSAGGVAGYNSETVENCVALNPSVSGVQPNFRSRIVGDNPGILADNYANSTLGNDWSPPINATDKGPTTKNGADVSTSSPNGGYNSQSFWQNTMGWDFTNVWKMGTVNGQTLPVLR